jgi:hypothetical protein
MILIGSFLEIYYYTYRFTADGIPWWLGIIIGAGLNLLLMLLVYWKKNSLMIIFLIAYSVISTSAGQTFSIIEKQKIEAEAKADPEKKRIEKEIELLQEERSGLSDQINGTIKTLEDRYEWQNTLGKAEKRITEIEEQIKTYNKAVEDLTKGETIKENNIYTFYENLMQGIIGKDFLKFVFHTVLSVFIALMAPTGIKIMLSSNGMTYGITTKEMDFKTWLELAYYGEARGRPKVPNENIMKEYFNIRGIEFDAVRNKKHFDKAVEKGYIDINGTHILKYEEVKGKELKGEKGK